VVALGERTALPLATEQIAVVIRLAKEALPAEEVLARAVAIQALPRRLSSIGLE
jgi:hypothetical protein